MTPLLYVAAASAEIGRAEAFRDACVAMGYTITFDWMANIRRVGAANEGVSDEDAMECCERSDRGVLDAEVFVLLLGKSSFGAAEEFGFARCDARVFDPPKTFLIVGSHPSVFLRRYPHVETDALALDWLRARKAGG
jgi:hypothetical protein